MTIGHNESFYSLQGPPTENLQISDTVTVGFSDPRVSIFDGVTLAADYSTIPGQIDEVEMRDGDGVAGHGPAGAVAVAAVSPAALEVLGRR